MTRSSDQIRREFVGFFEARGHTFVPSSSLLPADDPTLLFANAGMNQFKDVFLGTGTRPYRRAANSQKCIRAGGKHNDLEDVGHDVYHHTFFEMLGNWSFGDYFKAEAIEWAWELLTGLWGVQKEQLWVTVFGGNAAAGLARDDEAARCWAEKTDVNRAHVIDGSMQDNFWEMGETGPCGPCSEIHIDLGKAACDGAGHAGVECQVNASHCSRFVELWNLVFMQFNRDQKGQLTPLPAKHVDTGMGFERICRVLQGKSSNYDTDLFAPLLAWMETASRVRYGSAEATDMAFRVIADHCRACTFAITDGVLPSNDGRGSVIRRILRRAARYGRKLGQKEPFLFELSKVVVEKMGAAFPELAARGAFVADTLRQEEELFNRTLDRGIDRFEFEFNKVFIKKVKEKYPEAMVQFGADDPTNLQLTLKPGTPPVLTRRQDIPNWLLDIGGELVLPGKVAFELYATYGFPVDLTQVMAAEYHASVDQAGFDAEKDRHAKVSAAGGNNFQVTAVANLPATDDSAKYDERPLEARVAGWVIGDQFVIGGDTLAGEAAVVLDRTNFYGESGGQVGDSGELVWPGGKFVVQTTRLAGHCVLHVGKVEQGTLTVGQQVTCRVGPARMDTRRNHTGTHLLNWALRQVLGEGIDQAGSVVEPQRLRFDFTFGQAMTSEQLAQVEWKVNELILADEPVAVTVRPLAEARQLAGVRAVFGEKYPDPVRVVAVGTSDRVDMPAEFCGGTHLEHTGQVGLLKILSEESVARGVRRITAVTGREAVRYVQQLDQDARAAALLLRTAPSDLANRIAAMQAELKQLRKQAASGGAAATASAGAVEEIGGVKVIVCEVDAPGPEAMRNAVDQLRQKAGGSAAIMVGAKGEGTVTLVAGVSEEIVKSKGVKAGDWVKAAAAVVGGSGGGKPTMAQAGGKDPEKLAEALAVAKEWITQKLSRP